MGLLDYLTQISYLIRNHFFVFFLGSIITTLIGFSLSNLKNEKYSTQINYIHLIPIFLCPTIISKLFIDSLSSVFGEEIREANLPLFILGIVFHSWLAKFILLEIFDLKKRYRNYIYVKSTIQKLNQNTNILFYQILLSFSRPTLMTFSIIFVFFESMVSPWNFTTKRVSTIIGIMIRAGADPENSTLKPVIAFVTLAIFIIFILLSYLISKRIEAFAIKKMSDYKYRLNKGSSQSTSIRLYFIDRFFKTLRVLSTIFQIIVISICINSLVRVLLYETGDKSIYNDLNKIKASLASDAIIIGSLTGKIGDTDHLNSLQTDQSFSTTHLPADWVVFGD